MLFFKRKKKFRVHAIHLAKLLKLEWQVSKMGVTSILVGNGVNLGALRQGLAEFSQNVSTSEKNKQKWLKFSQKPNSSKKKEQE